MESNGFIKLGKGTFLALSFGYNPVTFVLEKGSGWDIFRLLVIAGLKDHPFMKDYVNNLIRTQNADGGFPKEQGKPSSIIHTVGVLQWLARLGVNARSPYILGAVDFFWKTQRVDGSWCENPEIILEEWMTWLSTEHGMPIVTSQIVQVLYDLGYERDPRIAKAIQYIKDTQRPDGHWPAHDDQEGTDPDASCIPALVKVGEANSRHVKRGIDAMLRLLAEENVEDAEEAYHLWKVWPTLVAAGCKFDREILERRLDRLKGIQREDGGWRFYWTQKSVPNYTTAILIDLIRAGFISKIDLRKAVENAGFVS